MNLFDGLSQSRRKSTYICLCRLNFDGSNVRNISQHGSSGRPYAFSHHPLSLQSICSQHTDWNLSSGTSSSKYSVFQDYIYAYNVLVLPPRYLNYPTSIDIPVSNVRNISQHGSSGRPYHLACNPYVLSTLTGIYHPAHHQANILYSRIIFMPIMYWFYALHI
jgi:hypothetical protein